ncbi:MAG: HlyD family secretion protein, partial [Burkholderiaceae bacterium]
MSEAAASRPRRARFVPMLVVALAAGLIGGWWLYRQFTHVFVDDARIAADMVVLSSRVPGWVTSIGVTEGEAVGPGALLVGIDERDAVLRLEELDARLAGIEAQRAGVEAQIHLTERQTTSRIEAQEAAMRASQASLTAAIARRTLAARESERAEALAPSGVLTRSRLDQSRATLEDARQQARQAQAELENARAAIAQAQADREEITVLERRFATLDAQARQLGAERARAELDLGDHRLMMPFDGVIDRVFIDVGEYVAPGQRLLMVHDPAQVRVEANVRETDIRHFAPGLPVSIRVDALPGERFEGRVTQVGHAATSEFALLPNPNPSGNFTKISQRLPVRIAI